MVKFMSDETKSKMPMILSAAVCSGSVLVALVIWMRNDAVMRSRMTLVEARVAMMETEAKTHDRAIVGMQSDLRALTQTSAETKTLVEKLVYKQ